MEFEEDLTALIRRLNELSTLSKQKAHELNRKALNLALPKMLEGCSYGEAMGGLSILNQSESEFRAELKGINTNLGRQIAIINEALDQWLEKGEIPPPYYAWRTAVTLRKAKRKSEEAAFLAGWCKHFGEVRGTRYEALADRARKVGAF